MWQRLKGSDRDLLSIGVVVLVIVFFVSVNIAASGLFRSSRLDLTADSLFTLSDGTREVVGAIDEPIEIRFYRSKDLELLGPLYSGHAERVGDLLDEYTRLSGGLLTIERFDPEPFSPEEDLAVADGLRGIPVDVDGTQIYFGLTGVNSTDDRRAIPLLAPERANFLEYDLTRLIYDLAHPDKPKVAVIGDLPLRGDQRNRFQPWAVVESMEQVFDLSFLGGEIAEIDAETEILLLAQPRSLPEQTLYAIDQFVMRGGRVLAFVDPHTEALQAAGPAAGHGNAVESLEPLFAAWGVAMESEKVVGDLLNASRVQAFHNGRQVVTDYLVWLGLRPQSFAADDVISANLQQINLRSAGAISQREGATTTLEPIFMSSAEAGLIDRTKIEFAPDPVALMNEFQSSGESYTLAARVSGPVKSAFPDGPPESVTDEALRAAHRAETEAPLNLILVGDADMLADRNWVQSQSLLGQVFVVPIANNGDFAVNALDNLAGSEGLIALRGRGLTRRPFEILDDMTRAAEQQFRAKEQELLARIEDSNEQIRKLQQDEQEGGAILSAEQQAAIDNFRVEMVALRAELREVQHALRQDVESLSAWIRGVNIWAVPAAVGLLAVLLALVRRMRAVRYQASAASRPAAAE